jgi:hypothetical protein
MDNTSNAVISGEVGGGKHFRGSVPYDPTTSFHAPLGSTKLDSFLRYSAVPQESGGYTPGYELFYSPTGTVSKIPPGRGGVFAPTSPRVAGGIGQWKAERPADVVDLGDSAIVRSPESAVRSPLQTTDYRLQIIPDELGRPAPEDRALSQSDQALTPEEYHRQMEELRQRLEKVKSDASRLEQSLRTGDTLPAEASKPVTSDPAEAALSRTSVEALVTPQSPASEGPGDSELLLIKPSPMIRETPSPEKAGQSLDVDVAGIVAPPGLTPAAGPKVNAATEFRPLPLGAQSNDGGLVADAATRTNRIAELFLVKGQGQAEPTKPNGSADLPAMQRIREVVGSPAYASKSAAGDTGPAEDRVTSLTERLKGAPSEMDLPTDMDANAPELGAARPSDRSVGEPVRPRYETLPKSSQEKLDRYLKTAQMYLQQGQYQRAVDSFSLASLYNPNDRRVNLGRSHALFAAGEYVSSAIFLAKAIEVDPDQTLAKSDLVNAVGGPDLFLQRITDLEGRAKTSATPDLQLLLAYIYHEMDRPQEAKTAIEAAEKGLPQVAAVHLLKAAIAN